MYKNEILNAIDDINLITSECEYDTINEMYNSYNKASMILENYDGDNLESFNVFNDTNEFYQESVSDKMKQSGAKYGTIMKIITFIPRLIKALFQTIIEKFKKAGKNKTKTDTSKFKKVPKEIKQKLAEAFDFSNPKKKRIAIISSIIGGTALAGGGVALGVHHHNKKKNNGDVIDDKPVDEKENTPEEAKPVTNEHLKHVESIAKNIIDAVEQMNQTTKKQTEQINKKIASVTSPTYSPAEGKITYDIDKGIFTIDYVDLEGLQNIMYLYMQNVISAIRDVEKYNKDKSSRNTMEKRLQNQLDKDNYGRATNEKGEIQYPESIVKALQRPVIIPITDDEFDKQLKSFIEKNKEINELENDYNKAIESLNLNNFKFVPVDIEAYIRRLHGYIKEISDAIKGYCDMLINLHNQCRFVYDHINHALAENVWDRNMNPPIVHDRILDGVNKEEYVFIKRFVNKILKNVSILGIGDIKYGDINPKCNEKLVPLAYTLYNGINNIINSFSYLSEIIVGIDFAIKEITQKSSDKTTYQKISKFLKTVGFNEESVNRAKIMENESLKDMFRIIYVHTDDSSKENQIHSVLMNPYKLRIPKELFADKNHDHIMIKGACNVYSTK